MTLILCYAVHSFEQEIPSMKAQAEKLEEAIRLGVERCTKKERSPPQNDRGEGYVH